MIAPEAQVISAPLHIANAQVPLLVQKSTQCDPPLQEAVQFWLT